MVAASSSSRPSRPGVRAAARSWVRVQALEQELQLARAVHDEHLQALAGPVEQLRGGVGVELALVDDQRLVAGAVRLDESVGERHVVAQQQRAVEELIRPAGVLHAEVLPPVVLAVAHPPAAVGVLVGNAVAVLVEERRCRTCCR